MGQPCLDSRIAPFSRLIEPGAEPENASLVPNATRQTLDALIGESEHSHIAVRLYFQGPAGAGQNGAAKSIALKLERRLLIVDLARLAASGSDLDTLVALCFREAQLLGAVMYLDRLDVLRSDDRAVALDGLLARVSAAPGIVILAGTQGWPSTSAAIDVIPVPFAVQDFEARRHYWQARLQDANIPASGADLDSLAGGFRFTLEQIDGVLTGARSQVRLRPVGTGDTPSVSQLFAIARAQSTGNLGSLARKIEPLYTWPDIVLPADQISQLREICSQARHRDVVFGNWGFDRKISYGKGLNVLFSGPPGTGKTMAAEILANDLRLGLYKIDLSQVVSKYIGETEKNLSRIFNEARATNAIIFFDEADALFGKRSEVRDAHDRYANIEIAYLLQKMEEYEGISILATNLRQNLDQAFTRRLSFSIDFPFPDEANRLLIWKSIWPAETPVEKDLDLEFVATQYKLSGGSVKNVAVAASFMAAEEGASVGTVHLLRAVRREFQKMGKSMSKTEFGRYWDRVEIPS
jgi:AAA+ superfamily predicted ATPase